MQTKLSCCTGVRLHAGRQASVLNLIIGELPLDHPLSDTQPLRDTLGHTPLQVTGRNAPRVAAAYSSDVHCTPLGKAVSAGDPCCLRGVCMGGMKRSIPLLCALFRRYSLHCSGSMQSKRCAYLIL